MIQFHDSFQFGEGHNVSSTDKSPVGQLDYCNLKNEAGNFSQIAITISRSQISNMNYVMYNMFDNSTGEFINNEYRLISSFTIGAVYDVEFSTYGKFLYYSVYGPSSLYQYNITSEELYRLAEFDNSNQTYDVSGGLAKAPDGYIYHVHAAGEPYTTQSGTVRIGRIITPDLQINQNYYGINDNIYERDVIVANGIYSLGLPEFLSIFDSKVDVKESNEYLANEAHIELQVHLFPNPVNFDLNLRLENHNGTYEGITTKIYDINGKLIFSEAYSRKIQVNFIKPGAYILEIIDQKGKSIRKQFIKT